MSNVNYKPEKFNVRIFDQKGDGHFVDLETLTHILQGIQKAIFVLARDELRLPSTKALPTKVKKAFSIRCAVPKPGSYAVPLEFGEYDALLSGDIFPESPRLVADKFHKCLEALHVGNEKAFTMIADPNNRKQFFTACRSMLPKAGVKWRVGFSSPQNPQEFQLTAKTVRTIKKIQESVLIHEEASLQTVTGYLVKMDFARCCITLEYPPTNTELHCYYTDDFEVELFENRRELLQVTGSVTYERDRETPKRIVNVDEIQFLDLSEFILETFCFGDTEIEFKEPLVLMPTLTESSQFITLQDERIGIDVIAQTREELEEELHADLKMLWEYSQMPNDKLGKVFRSRKDHFLAAIKEVQ